MTIKQKKIGYIGLGKMGSNMVSRLHSKGYDIVATSPSESSRKRVEEFGVKTVSENAVLPGALATPRTLWLMVPHKAVDGVLEEIISHLSEGDMVIDGGNSRYTDTVRRAGALAEKGIRFMDVGVSGGPKGALEGASLMVGGDKKDFDEYAELFSDLAVPNGFGYMGAHGAGHFVKMVHNGIEYGMMQAIGEGFEILKKSAFSLDVAEAARVYSRGTVIQSRLIDWLVSAYKKHGQDLEGISGEVSHSGEGQWTVEAAREIGVPVKVIEDALQFRKDSQGNPSYTGQVVSALRNEFGGHDVSKK
ncbi:MAG: 6-phosphogluconate dehydrogenase (decarboxylating) [Candidatus Lloydbacteria bacterium CG22_combo_CG10-13_8_21_14_all_47_15]|uniref:6-phosphogluconate dehydrogenase (Decarboxylating) n=1 Tax=Candidatus Lloydbacteria bacterium CG22_combo_CG10-13_8_21_14_all_47_15 TaxID=1974635 RepID=A0A2H0CUU4_9BACT|nr:MAG: 6-phosphogluconate dehydrogenase (decarboxylating) [Candidatus Lloydbacteria bacterium CG22_combo_CG10-13_8_21_14_all_47_15]